MASSCTLPSNRPPPMDRSGSFFKLIDTFASEIGELKQEMVQTALDRDGGPAALQGLEGEVNGVYMQCPTIAGAGGERDSGYDSLRRRMSVLDRLTQTHPVWLLLTLSQEEARRVLMKQPPGVFLVRRSVSLQRKVLSVRLSEDGSASSIGDFPVKESQYTFSLEGSGLSFADLLRLVAFYCISRDVLPFALQLPEAIAAAKTQKDLEEAAQLGAGFWDSALGSPSRSPPARPVSRTLSPPRSDRDRGADQGGQHRHDSAPPTLRARGPTPYSPRGQERSQSNGALCFVNPLFLQAHYRRHQPDPSPSYASESNGGSPTVVDPHGTFADTTGHPDPQTDATVSRKLRPPPPRPPPPRSMSVCRPAPPIPTKRRSMPETAGVVARPQESPSRRPPLARQSKVPPMGPKLSSPSKKGVAPPPPRPKKPDLDAHRCHIALDDETIAKALSQAKVASPPLPAELLVVDGADSPPAPPVQTPRGEGRQRLSDVSLSTSSSDSLDYSMGLPPGGHHRRHPRSRRAPAPEDSSEDEEEEEDEEDEKDYGVSLENDLDVSLQPPFRARRRGVGVGLRGSSFILPRALKGHFRKVSGVFSSLMTPERRAVKRIAEVSRDKSSYFGCLVQDYISFVQENRGCHTSGMDLLQTLRQFMTQMKAYLRQSSELDPPIESLIPEDQIDQVLEKAMHKCVLKPLKSVVEVALHDFQVDSGGWQQMRENLALAKAKKPQDLGVDGAVPPDAVAIEKIRHKFLSMRKMYSPEKKVSLLLRVCKLIYTIMQDNSGRMYGADDFLPMLTYVLAQCDMPQLDTEIQYMMELLDPSLLHGEGGYYLTSAYGAIALIKNFQEEQAARVLSSEARDTLHQWHRRRTTQRTAPSVDDFQNYLRVALQKVDTGCTAKTLLVHPYSTTEEVCSLCACKFKVPDPQNYTLFLLTDESSQQLAPDTHPQLIKAEIHSRPRAQTFNFVYRRGPNLNICVSQDTGKLT
ncbi:ras and Rab interactor 2-like [Aplochiton taeniatus]